MVLRMKELSCTAYGEVVSICRVLISVSGSSMMRRMCGSGVVFSTEWNS